MPFIKRSPSIPNIIFVLCLSLKAVKRFFRFCAAVSRQRGQIFDDEIAPQKSRQEVEHWNEAHHDLPSDMSNDVAITRMWTVSLKSDAFNQHKSPQRNNMEVIKYVAKNLLIARNNQFSVAFLSRFW